MGTEFVRLGQTGGAAFPKESGLGGGHYTCTFDAQEIEICPNGAPKPPGAMRL